MGRLPFCFSYLVRTSALVACIAAQSSAQAEERDDRGDRDRQRPVYQRHAFDWMDKHGRGNKWGHGRFPQFAAPQVSSGWFQRPYPYHLDYYKMRYGGSYAPYFGNLYGPPQVVTAPPYYGPYYGSYVSGDPNAYGPSSGQPGFPTGPVFEAPVEGAVPSSQPVAPSNGESLPSP